MADDEVRAVRKGSAHVHAVWINCARCVAVIAACLAGAVTLSLAVLFTERGLPLTVFSDTIAQRLAGQLDAEEIRVESLHLKADRDAGGLTLSARGLEVVDADGLSVTLPSAELLLVRAAGTDTLLSPSFLTIDGAEIVIVRQADGGLSSGAADKNAGGFDLSSVLDLATKAGFSGAALTGSAVVYRDLATGREARFEGVDVALGGDQDAWRATAQVPVGVDGRAEATIFAAPKGGQLAAEVRFAEIRPEDLPGLYIGEAENVRIDTALSGELIARGSLEAGFEAMDFTLGATPGRMTLGALDLPIVTATAAGQADLLAQTLAVTELVYDVGGNQARITGDAAYELGANGLGPITFQAVAEEVVLAAEGFFPGDVPIKTINVGGGFDPKERVLSFSTIEADYHGASVNGTAALAFPLAPTDIMGVETDLAVKGSLTPQQVLAAWPVPAGDGARRWVVANLPSGDIHGATFSMTMPRGAAISADAIDMDLVFKAKNATVIYVPGMTPLTGVVATGRIANNEFDLDVTRGQVGNVALTSGGMRVPQLVPKGARATFNINVAGELPDILRVLDEEPLGYLSSSGMSPDQFTGRGTFSLQITRPMLSSVPLDDYTFDGQGTFSQLELSDYVPGFEMASGEGTVILSKEALTIAGDVGIEGLPASFSWKRNFGGEGDIVFAANTSLTPKAADRLGFSLRRYLQGTVDISVRALGTRQGYERTEVVADLTRAALMLDGQQIIKPAGVAGDLRLAAKFPENSQETPIIIESLKVEMPKVYVEGSARAYSNGELVDLDLPRVYIDQLADLSARFQRDGERLSLSLDGAFLDASRFIDDVLNRPAGAGGLPRGIDLDVHLDRVALKSDVELTNLVASGGYGGAQATQLEAEAGIGAGNGIWATFSPNATGIGQDFVLTTDNLGALMGGVLGLSSVEGGAARLTATLIEEGPIVGHLSARMITLRDAPTVARLLSVGSLDGLANVLNGDGIDFDEIEADVQLDSGKVRLVDARMTGSALGVSANGVVNLGDGVLNVHGAVAPAYGVNGLLGALPGLGDVLVSREGEGVFAFSYHLDGSFDDASVQVNTLAALTPGIFRRMFEPILEEMPTTSELLEAAEAEAGLEEEGSFLSTEDLLEVYQRGQGDTPTGEAP